MRIRSGQYEKCKKNDWKLIDCFELGFQKKEENELSDLDKRIDSAYAKYIQLKKKREVFGTKQDSELKKLDILKKWFLKQNRSIDNPTSKDINALKFQMEKRKIETYTVEQVFDYWRD